MMKAILHIYNILVKETHFLNLHSFSFMFSFFLLFENRRQSNWFQQVRENSGNIRFYERCYSVHKKGIKILWQFSRWPTGLKVIIISSKKYFFGLTCVNELKNQPNRFHVALRLFGNRSEMTSKCVKNRKVTHEPLKSVSLMYVIVDYKRNWLVVKGNDGQEKSKENWGDFFLPRFHFPSRRSLATSLFSKRSINQSIIYFSTLRRGAKKTPSKYESV